MFAKVFNQEERNNPRRKRRLRKKLRVAEFTENVTTLFFDKSGISVPEDEMIDFVLEESFKIENFVIGMVGFTNGSLFVMIEEPFDNLEEFVNMIGSVGGVLLREIVEDAWYD